jgi:hypothetical protein
VARRLSQHERLSMAFQRACRFLVYRASFFHCSSEMVVRESLEGSSATNEVQNRMAFRATAPDESKELLEIPKQREK